MSLYEIIFTNEAGELLTTTKEFDHSFFEVEDEYLRPFENEDIRSLIDYLKTKLKPNRIQVTTFYRDGDREYEEIHHMPLDENVDYDKLTQDEIMDMYYFGHKGTAEKHYDGGMDLYWDTGFERALWVSICRVVK